MYGSILTVSHIFSLFFFLVILNVQQSGSFEEAFAPMYLLMIFFFNPFCCSLMKYLTPKSLTETSQKIPIVINEEQTRGLLVESMHATLISSLWLFAPVPVIKKTWEKDALYMEYYSDHADASIPTINIGVPNTERGKCTFGR